MEPDGDQQENGEEVVPPSRRRIGLGKQDILAVGGQSDGDEAPPPTAGLPYNSPPPAQASGRGGAAARTSLPPAVIIHSLMPLYRDMPRVVQVLTLWNTIAGRREITLCG